MRNAAGGFYSTYREDNQKSDVYGINHEVTSESVGLVLIYAVAARNHSLFQEQFTFLRNYQIGSLGMTYWKLKPDLKPYPNSAGSFSAALIDDLRILKALISGYELWKDENYIRLARGMISGIQHYRTADNLLVDNVDWVEGGSSQKSEIVILGYLDLLALLKASKYEESMTAVYDRATKLVTGGQQRETGLFHELYNTSSSAYITPKGVSSTIFQILIALSLSETGLKKELNASYTFLKTAYLKDGVVHSAYDPRDGSHHDDEIDTGSYSLLARLALLEGDVTLARRILEEKVLPEQDKQTGSPLCGAFTTTWPSGFLDANSWDNLLTIHFLEEMAISLQVIIPEISTESSSMSPLIVVALAVGATILLARKLKLS